MKNMETNGAGKGEGREEAAAEEVMIASINWHFHKTHAGLRSLVIGISLIKVIQIVNLYSQHKLLRLLAAAAATWVKNGLLNLSIYPYVNLWADVRRVASGTQKWTTCKFNFDARKSIQQRSNVADIIILVY